MSHLPESSVFTRYLLENPWPIIIVLGLAGLVIGGSGLRDGVLSRLRTAAVLFVLAGAAYATDRFVVTSGEEAAQTVRELVDAVAAVDMVAVDAMLDPECALHRGSPTNPGTSLAPLLRRYERFAGGSPIESHSITSLKYASASEDVGEVQFAVSVSTDSGGGFTAWHVRVRRSGTQWLVTDLTWLKWNGQDPPNIGGMR